MHARSIVGVGGAFTGALSGELAQETPGAAPPATMASSVATLFQNVRIFDGTSAALSAPSHVTLGVVKEGALADLLLVEGNLLENIQLIEDPDQNFPDTSATVEIEDQWLSQQSLANSSILRPTVATIKVGFPPMAEIQTKTPPHLYIRLDPTLDSDILATLYQSPADPPAMFEMVPPQEPPMRKRRASLRPSREQPALPILPAQSRSLVRPNR